VLVFQHGLRLMLCQVFILQFPFYLVHVGKHIRIKQPEGCLIMLQDVVVSGRTDCDRNPIRTC
jgi:hypothetical protein